MAGRTARAEEEPPRFRWRRRAQACACAGSGEGATSAIGAETWGRTLHGPNAAARQIGESLPGDAVIRYIERRRVVVEQQGELKALPLTEPSLTGSGAALAPAIPMMPGSPPQQFQTNGAPQAPVYEAPQPEYEPPPEELDNEAQYEDPMQADESVEFEDSEPTE